MKYDQLKKQLFDIAFAEDLGPGDQTSLACIPTDKVQKAKIYAKDKGVVAGVQLGKELFENKIPGVTIAIMKNDGDQVKNGETIMEIEGNAILLLSTERIVLNFMQRLSGIATLTYNVTQKIAHTNAKVLDTRKTTPGLRIFEKEAVKIGGGHNHRMGLFDMIMIKDNHIDFAGGIDAAIQKANTYRSENNADLKIEIEVRDFNELNTVLQHGNIDRIMLDNFTPETLQKAIELIDGKYETEASGGITIDTIVPYAETGVDYISLGALTHSAKNFDISMVALGE